MKQALGWLAALWLVVAGAALRAEDLPMANLEIGDGSGWTFVGGPWTQTEGIIRPPDRRDLHSRAFRSTEAYADVAVTFDYNPSYRETGAGCAGLILRAADINHFYLVYFPWNAMNLRAKHFWGVLAKVEGDGYLRNLKAAWVPGVVSETERWFHVRVAAAGSRITVEVDGHPALSESDDTFARGRVGLAGYGWYSFRNVRISGDVVAAGEWDGGGQVPSHWFEVGLSSGQMPSGCVAADGEVLLLSGDELVRSRDKGRTWDQPAALPAHLIDTGGRWDALTRTADGGLLMMNYQRRDQTDLPTPRIMMAESADSGRTWSESMVSQVADGWPQQPAALHPYGTLAETSNGTLLRFIYGEVGHFREWGEPGTLTDIRTWSAVHCKAYVIRSTDGGSSWSAPIEMDQPAWANTARGTIPGSMDFTESTGVANGSEVMVLIRPVYSPLMWQCRSNDHGATWDAAVRTTFPGYAQSILRMGSGAIVCAHRFPQYSINISTDEGVTWDEGTVIDYPVWAMGCLVEVEPDVMLATYMAAERSDPLRAQLIRIVPTDQAAAGTAGSVTAVRIVPQPR